MPSKKRYRPPCVRTCPNHANAHAYVALIAKGKFKEAMKIIMKGLPFPATLGRICPHPCEYACRRGQFDEPVAICALKRFVADRVDINTLPPPKIEWKEERVAIVGSGPSGLACAYFLALRGYRSTVFEALPVVGGMLRVGIPDYRLPPEVLNREIKAITRLGIEIKTSTSMGRDLNIDDLFNQGYKAIHVAIGAHKSLKLNIAGESHKDVIPGTCFLRLINLGDIDRIEGNVAIIGGGDVAIDGARSALRMGAEKVVILYRRTRKEMPARHEEIEAAIEEGVDIQFLTAPKRIVIENGKVAGIECLRQKLGECDESGRCRPVPIEGSEFVFPCNMVIPAVGQRPDSSFLADIPGISLTRRNTIKVDKITLATGREGVFAGGDTVTGPWIAIGAVAAGKRAAISISRYLMGEDVRAGREEEGAQREDTWPIPSDTVHIPRSKIPTIPISERRRGFKEVELGLTEEMAVAEAKRCLNCPVHAARKPH